MDREQYILMLGCKGLDKWKVLGPWQGKLNTSIKGWLLSTVGPPLVMGKKHGLHWSHASSVLSQSSSP